MPSALNSSRGNDFHWFCHNGENIVFIIMGSFIFPSKYVLGNEPGHLQVRGSAINLHAQALIF